MRLSLQIQYAICGAFDLAYNAGEGPVGIRVISARQTIPARYLEQIFQRLRRANIVTSKRGPGGGYTLARLPSKISLREIVEAVEGSLADALHMVPASDPGAAAYRPDFLWEHLADRFAGALEETTLEALCREAARTGVKRDHSDAAMYFI
jgi:Rrf2 family protein